MISADQIVWKRASEVHDTVLFVDFTLHMANLSEIRAINAAGSKPIGNFDVVASYLGEVRVGLKWNNKRLDEASA